jgi:predicted metal-dependent hydrolase
MLFRTRQKHNLRQKPDFSAVPAEIGGIRVRPSARARRMALRVESATGEVVLTWPARGMSEKKAKNFIEEHRNWIETQQHRSAKIPRFAPEGNIRIGGSDYILTQGARRGLTRIEGDRIVVCGDPAHFRRRLKDFLKAEALKILTEASAAKSLDIGLAPPPVRVIDPKTRWGSCAPDGRLMFSWRLLLAPPAVLDYVVAHEVAHRIHMNHSRRFWSLCLSLCEDGAESRRWLKKHGTALMSML